MKDYIYKQVLAGLLRLQFFESPIYDTLTVVWHIFGSKPFTLCDKLSLRLINLQSSDSVL